MSTRTRRTTPGTGDVVIRNLLAGITYLLSMAVISIVLDKRGSGGLFLPVVLAAGSLTLVYVVRQSVTARENERRAVRLYTVCRLLNSVLRHDISGKLTDIRYGIETSGIHDNEGIDAAYESAGAGIELVRHIKSLGELAEKEVHLEPQDVRALLDGVAAEQHFPVLIEGDAKVLADAGLRSVFENIVRNAKMHSGAERMVATVAEGAGHVRIILKDEGKGIPEGFQDKLFTEGFKFGETANTGIGLYIVRELVTRYGGTVRYAPTEPHGATFIITLKKA